MRYLPEGTVCAAMIRSAQGQVLELDLQTPAPEFIPGAAAEIKAAETIYLGVVKRRHDKRIWISVEHLLDRKMLARIQAAWKE